MTKFKERYLFKQYLPLKPVKRDIKVWMKCDASTGYTYDMNVYAGRKEKRCKNTVGERVLFALAVTIKNQDVTLAFDRYLTLVRLMDTLSFAAVGTCIKNRKPMPSFTTTLKKSESDFKSKNNGTIAVRWQDTREVLLLSNCHTDSMGQIQKDGSRKSTTCPTTIQFYREKMGGVDRAD